MHRAARRLHDIETLCEAAVTQLVRMYIYICIYIYIYIYICICIYI